MSFADFPDQARPVELLQRSLRRGRLGHAYLFQGPEMPVLASVARTLAKVLNCQGTAEGAGEGMVTESCDRCGVCRRIDAEEHPDVHWLRPESKLRVITIEQVRELLSAVHLKPAEARYKVAVLEGADRLNTQAANAFLKTLEEPPTRCVFVLLSTDSQRLIETILSRCLRLSFAGREVAAADPAHASWLAAFAGDAASGNRDLMGRYRLLGQLLGCLAGLKADLEKTLREKSPLEKYDDVEPRLAEKWEDELTAGVEAEYRRRRAELLQCLHWWLRDVWLCCHGLPDGLRRFPELGDLSTQVAVRLDRADASENLRVIERLQRLLSTNIQEALALEVGLLRLRF